MGCYFLLQGIFLTQGSNLVLLHSRQILHCLSHQGRPSKAKLACYSRYLLTSYFCIPIPCDEKDIIFFVLVPDKVVGFHAAAAAAAKSLLSCLTLRDPMDCSLPGSSGHGIFQARVLEWGAIAFSVSVLDPIK